MEYTGADRRAKESWHLQKSFSIGNIISVVTALSAIFIWMYKLDVRTQLTEHLAKSNTMLISQNEKRRDQQIQEISIRRDKEVTEIKNYLIRIEDKIDRLKK